MTTTEPQVDVCSGDVRKVLASLDGDKPALRTDCVEESHGQSTRPRAGFNDRRAREDVAHVGDDARILRVHNSRSARHRHNVVDLEGTQNLELTALFRDDNLAVGTADDVVMVESAAIGLETATADENHLVEAAFGVTNLNAVPLGEDTSAGRLAIIVGRHRSITLNRHYVKDTACH